MRTATIVFTDEWLPYSPTVLNMLECLKAEGYRPTVVTVRAGLFRNFEKFADDVRSYRIPSVVQKALNRLGLSRLVKAWTFRLLYRREIRDADLCFGVDALGYVIARRIRADVTYVSLEVERDAWFDRARSLGIRQVLIQTRERFDFLFGDSATKPECLILPNSPVLAEPVEPGSPGRELVYFGYVSASHGVEACLEAMRLLPSSHRLTVKGPGREAYVADLKNRFADLFQSYRATIDSSYVAQKDVVAYLRRFEVGFCFYDFDLIAKGDFNYTSCPSGKLYNYLAAGVPVVGSDISGLRVVRDENCGRLLGRIAADDVARAVLEIESDFPGFQARCLNVGRRFEFARHFRIILAKII